MICEKAKNVYSGISHNIKRKIYNTENRTIFINSLAQYVDMLYFKFKNFGLIKGCMIILLESTYFDQKIFDDLRDEVFKNYINETQKVNILIFYSLGSFNKNEADSIIMPTFRNDMGLVLYITIKENIYDKVRFYKKFIPIMYLMCENAKLIIEAIDNQFSGSNAEVNPI